MLRRWRWLVFLAAVGAFAVGFAYALAMFAPAPEAPDSARETVDERAAVEPGCGDDVPQRMFVGVHDDAVAIFTGDPGGCRRLVEVKSISVRGLPAFQRSDLERGITFSSEDELFQILEGLTAP